MKRITQETVNRAIDYTTGEVKQESSSVTYSLPSEPDFVKVYLQDLLYLVDLPRYQWGVLLWVMKNCNYASAKYGQCVVLTAALKEEIAESVGLKLVSSVNSVLYKLSKKHVIEHVSRSIYRLNPYLFGRGKWQEIQQLQKIACVDMHIKYTRDGKEISSTIETVDEGAFSLKKHLDELQEAEQEEKKAS